MEKKEVYPTSIRLEKELYKKVSSDAEKKGRSITKQIEYMIKRYYEIKES